MKLKFLLFILFFAVSFDMKAQDSTLTISGSVDTYFKHDFADKSGNINTSFASDHNSMSIGMISLAVKKKIKKAAFVGEMAFGPRGQHQSLLAGAGGDSYHVQNLYISYDLTDKLALTAGFMGTFIGYEVINPTGNFNYSTSYLFSAGPFQNAGFKATYTFSDKISLMAGIFNDNWNVYTSTKRMDSFGAQLGLFPSENVSLYLNALTGDASGTIFDVTGSCQITNAFKLGLNAADYSAPGKNSGGYQGVALYPQMAVSSVVSIGLRGEYFKYKNYVDAANVSVASSSRKSVTLTANIKEGPLTFIPEIRLDGSEDNVFVGKSGTPVKTASQFVLAAVYAF